MCCVRSTLAASRASARCAACTSPPGRQQCAAALTVCCAHRALANPRPPQVARLWSDCAQGVSRLPGPAAASHGWRPRPHSPHAPRRLCLGRPALLAPPWSLTPAPLHDTIHSPIKSTHKKPKNLRARQPAATAVRPRRRPPFFRPPKPSWCRAASRPGSPAGSSSTLIPWYATRPLSPSSTRALLCVGEV